MRCVALCCLLVLPACLVLMDRPTGTEEQEAPAPTGADLGESSGSASELTCVYRSAEGLGVISGSTLGADDEFDGCGIGGEAVISWVAPSRDVFTFSVSANFDSVIGIHGPSCGSSPMECADDCNGMDAAVEYSAERGEELLIVVESYNGASGSFSLAIERDYLYCGYGSSSSGGGSSSTTYDPYTSTSW